MSNRKHWIFTILMLLIASALPGITLAQESEEGRTGYRFDAPHYGVRGPYPVGTSAATIDGEAPLNITMWFPALNDAGAAAVTTYPYETNPDTSPGMDPMVSGQAISDAPYDRSAAPYPLVVLSHGFSLGRTGYAWLAENLASHGFVVIAPQHYERVDETLGDFWQAAITRPQEIVTVLNYIDTQVSDGNALEGLIDPDRVAVVGHSYGGYTALALAGARFDINGMQALCEAAYAEEDPNAWLCGLFLNNVDAMAEMMGLDTIPDGLWPSLSDPRVDVIVSMAGDAYLFDQAGLAEITIPVMAIGGTADTGTPYAWGTYPTYEYVSSPSKVRVSLENAEHMVFGATCEDLPWFTEIGFAPYCSDPVWDMDRVHDLVNHFTAAFLLAELKQDSDASTTLMPDAVSFPGVLYDAQGY